MRIEPDPVNPLGQIDPTQVKSASEVADEAALQIVVQDALSSEAWLNQNYWGLRWREADMLYQSPPSVTMWPGTTVPRANVNRFVVAETVNSIHPQILNGLFYESPPFVLRPRPNLSQDTTRAISALIGMQLDEIQLQQEVDWGISSALLFGTAIWKWGFKSYTRTTTKYKPLADPVSVPSSITGQPPTVLETPESMMYQRVEEEEQVYTPTFENRDIRYVLPDRACKVPDIRRGKYVVDKMYLTYKDLIKLKDEEYVWVDPTTKKQTLKKRYNLPKESVIKSWFEKPKEQPAPGSRTDANIPLGTAFVHHAAPQFEATTADPLDEPLEVLERWDNDKVITVLNRVKLIRNEPNEFGVIPFLSVNWWNVPDAFWGLGLGRVIGVEQRVQAGLINACLDLASLIVNPMFVKARGSNVMEQQIMQRIGGIISVDGNDSTKALTILEQPTIPNEVVQQIGMSQSRVEMTSGASQQFTAGANQGKAGAARSGTGAAGLIQATMTRIGGFAETFARQVYQPFIYACHKMNKEKMPMAYIKKVLGEKLGDDFKFSADQFMNAPAEFEILAGSHLAAKAQMAQSLFLMTQIFDNQTMLSQLADLGLKLDVNELLHMIHDISGWKNYYDLIKKMTPEELQRKQQNSPMAQQQAKLQGQMQLNNQKSGLTQQVIDQENEARAARDVFRIIAEKSAEPEALLGAEAPTQGVGSVEAG